MNFVGLWRPLICLAWLIVAPAVLAGVSEVPKHALVIANGEYKNRQWGLPNVARDQTLVAASLKKLGFTVIERSNLGREQMVSAVAEFAAALPVGATALVYFGGHGMQVAGGNYLVPVDMVPTSEQSVQLKTYPVVTLLERLSAAKSSVNIVVLDACRNNPFQPAQPVRYRSFDKLGLASTHAPRGTLIAYSTAPGQLAEDGKGPNSTYAAALARHIVMPAVELEQIFKRVADEVRRKTLDDQIPWYESSLVDKYYFLPPEGVAVLAGKPLLVSKIYKSDASVSRGMERGGAVDASEGISAWYRQLDAREWSQVDWEIQQRVRRLTPDEIPALMHKASGGSVLAQTTLGLAYREGVERAGDGSRGQTLRFKANNGQAFKWLKKAADSGFPVAQTELGEMYYQAHGVNRDLREAAHWLEQAAAADYPRARLDLLQVQLEAGIKPANPSDAANSLFRSFSGVAGREP